MSDTQMKILILVLIIAIAGVGVGLYFTVTNNNKEYAKLQEEIAQKKEEEAEKNKQEQENNVNQEKTIVGITNAKVYNITQKVIANNMYIEVEVGGVVTKKAVKDDRIYSSTNHITNIIMDEKSYTIDSNAKTVTIKNSNNEKFSISFIDTDINKYTNTEIKQGKEEYNGQIYDYEIIEGIKYYYNGDNLQYVINDGKETKINRVTDAQDSLFEIPQDYQIIDETIVNE